MHPILTLAVYCGLIAVGSLLGGWLPLWVRLTHLRMQLLMSLVAGLMLGVSLFHLLPHAVVELDSVDTAVSWMMIGFIVMFVMIRAFHFHQHEAIVADASTSTVAPAEHGCSHHATHFPLTTLNWLGLAFGLSVHTLIDGIALAANVMADSEEGVASAFLGLGTFLAVFLHKPLDALSITALMTSGNWSHRARQAVNLAFSMMCPLGALCFFGGMKELPAEQELVLGAVLGFSAGVFLCISLADIMPELELHSHNRFRLSFALLLGIALAYGIHLIEPAHAHLHEQHVHSSG
jgi:zinc and cadmium transporter